MSPMHKHGFLRSGGDSARARYPKLLAPNRSSLNEDCDLFVPSEPPDEQRDSTDFNRRRPPTWRFRGEARVRMMPETKV